MPRTASADHLILDLETIPDTGRWQRPEGGEAAFPPTWAHRIIAIGFLVVDHAYRVTRIGIVPAPDAATPDARERALLAELSRVIEELRPVLVTYNGRSFDLPVIALRALCHGVPLRWYYRDRGMRSRYSEDGHLDLCDWLADHGATRASKLDQIARLIGLPGKVGIDGSQVEGLFLDGKLDLIESYCLGDVAQTALLFLRFRLLQGRLSPAAYQARTQELLDALARDGRVDEVLASLDRAHLLA